MNYLRRRCTCNIQISPLTKIIKLMPASYLFPLSRHAENETKWFWLACEHRRILVGYLTIIQVYERHGGANKMQIEQHWVIPQTVSYSAQRNWKQQVLRRNNRTWKMAKWDFAWILISNIRLNIRKEMEDSRLNAIECLKTDYDWILAARVQQQLMLILWNLF